MDEFPNGAYSDTADGLSTPSAALIDALTSGYAAHALEAANIPTLLSVLYQLTGDEKWVREPYRPTRTRGLEDHDTGGLGPVAQREVRIAAVRALRSWVHGSAMSVPAPVGEDLLELMSANIGEPVDPIFEPMMAAELGFRSVTLPTAPASSTRDFSVLIVGAGVSGMAVATALRRVGVPFTVVEKNAEVGGTWLDNRYPGCGVDTPSYLYSFSYLPREWSTYFGKRDEVEDYLRSFADAQELRGHIRFGVELIAAEWNDHSATWCAELRRADGACETIQANVLITAVGQLNRPKIPELAGLADFKGLAFHSARWPDDLVAAGKRIALVGSGASAMQIAPAIYDKVESLTIFQRSPQWIAPNVNYFRPVSPETHWLLANVPFYQRWYRFRLAWNFNDKIHPTLQIDPDWPDQARSINAANDGHRRYLTRYIEEQLDGRPDLLVKAQPTYPPFGKRMLLDNGWFRALRAPNVKLVTDAVERVDEHTVIDDRGRAHEVDVVVFATGFEAQRLLFPLSVRGRTTTIREAWGDDDPRAYLGMTMPGFPNLFVMYGPNTNLGHGGSWVTMAECQGRYIAQLVGAMLTDAVAVVECRPEVYESFNRAVDDAHSRMIWTHPGMGSWYRNPAGRVVTNFPWRVADYWQMTAVPDLEDFVVTAREQVG